MTAITEISALSKGATAPQQPLYFQEQDLNSYSANVQDLGVANPDMEILANPSALLYRSLGAAESYMEHSAEVSNSIGNYSAAYYDQPSSGLSVSNLGVGSDRGSLPPAFGGSGSGSGRSLVQSLDLNDDKYRPLVDKMMTSVKAATESALISTAIGNISASINSLIKGQ